MMEYIATVALFGVIGMVAVSIASFRAVSKANDRAERERKRADIAAENLNECEYRLRKSTASLNERTLRVQELEAGLKKLLGDGPHAHWTTISTVTGART